MSKYVLNTVTRDRVLAQIGKMNLSRAWDITIEPHVKARTNEQNARLWALHTKAAEVTGYTPAQMHELALSRYFGAQKLQVGEAAVVWIPKKRSSQRDVKEFAEFMTSTEEWYVSDLGVWLD